MGVEACVECFCYPDDDNNNAAGVRSAAAAGFTSQPFLLTARARSADLKKATIPQTSSSESCQHYGHQPALRSKE
jgi:hypothetical protein